MKTRYLAFVLASSLSFGAAAQETLRTFELAPTGPVTVTTDLFIRQGGTQEFLYTPLADAMPGSLTALDVSRGQALTVHPTKRQVAVALPSPIPAKAEFRLRLRETIAGSGLTVHRTLTAGRYLFVLPTGYGLKSCSLPAQIETTDGHIRVGIVVGSDLPTPVDLEIEKQSGGKDIPFEGNFLAADNRIVSYQLLDPNEHTIRLWLELYVDHPGQSHFYSQLRIPDNVSNPVTVDMDRGVELPTRIVTGKEANAIGDSPVAFPEDAQVLVADIGYEVQAGGSARLRSYQTATDAPNYRMTAPNEFRLDRFIARTRTQYMLPAGWGLASMDQPGVISRAPDGRIVIDFVGSSSAGSKLVLIGRKAQ